MCNKLLHWGFNWRIHKTINKVNYNDAGLFKLSRTKRQRNFHKFSTLPLACAGQSSNQLQLLLWLLGLCIPMRSRSALNCAGTMDLV